MKMKNFLAVLLTSVMAVGCLAGCGSSDETAEQKKESGSSQESTSAASTDVAVTEEKESPITTDPITISIFAQMSDAEADVSNLWYFKYLEYWMKEQGYNVTIEVASSEEPTQQQSLMLATDSLADLYIGPALNNSQAVMYGAGDGIVLDWKPYLNEETMPNIWALLQENQDALAASTCLDGGIYGLPYFADRNEAEGAGNYIGASAYINKDWLAECNLEIPTTMDGFIDMLRAFKENIKLENGEEVIPFVSVPGAARLERYLWASLGYYGGGSERYGTKLSIKNEEVHLPAYTEDYDKFIEIMKTLYDEGLISKDHFTMDDTTARGLVASGVCGVMGDWTMVTVTPDTFADWVAAPPISAGDNEVYASGSASYRLNSIWASASTEYPEVLALLVDYMYSPEGIAYYYYGPMQGEDPLNLVDGWYVNEDGNVTTKLADDGTFGSMEYYSQRYIYPWQYGVSRVKTLQTAYELAGVDKKIETFEVVDAITGKAVEITKTGVYTMDDANGYGRFTVIDAWEGHQTYVLLPSVYMTEEQALRATEIATLINNHITAESAKFITGVRPISEIETFKEELKTMGVEEYIEMYRNAYATYMDSIFK